MLSHCQQCEGRRHPLVLFLDDLQWAGWTRLKLLAGSVSLAGQHPGVGECVERAITLSPRATLVVDKALGSSERSHTRIPSLHSLEAAMWQASEVEISSQGLTWRPRTPVLEAGHSLLSAGGARLTRPGMPRARGP
jgi:hypothetical protein